MLLILDILDDVTEDTVSVVLVLDGCAVVTVML